MRYISRLSSLMLIVLVLALPLAVSAQTNTAEAVDGGVIEYGETVEGELSDDAPAINYTFTGSEDDSVVITLISEDFDTYLALLDEAGHQERGGRLGVLERHPLGGQDLGCQCPGEVLPAEHAFAGRRPENCRIRLIWSALVD